MKGANPCPDLHPLQHRPSAGLAVVGAVQYAQPDTLWSDATAGSQDWAI